MKLIWFFGSLVLNTIIVTSLVWWVSEIGNYAFWVPVIFVIVSGIITIVSSDKNNNKIAVATLLGALLSLPSVFVMSFVMLIASGGMC